MVGAAASLADQVLAIAITVAVTQIIAGGVLLFAWYHVNKRFVDHEYPATVQRITSQITNLETMVRAEFQSVRLDLSGVRSDIGSHRERLTEHGTTIREHERRITRVEDKIDERGTRREPDLDDTRTGRR